ncbi:MAG: PASTA domain-containing protein [Ruminococcaceae bacterium]|nr:PASTA domain-containing protein [Oscillospiraceae bacterium]
MNDPMIHSSVLRRARVVSLVLIGLFTILMFRILWIQTVDYDRYQAKVIEQMTTESTVNAKRGNIYDRNGVLIATNVTTYRVFISPSGIASAQRKATEAGDDVDYADKISRGLSSYLNEEYGVTYDFVMKQTTYEKYLDRTVARHVDEETADRIVAFVSENKLGNMVYLEATSSRYYPYGSLAAHVIGFTGSDGTGLYGLEYLYNEQLAGTPGKYIIARDAQSNEMPYEYEQYIPAVDGYDITSTIDIYIQAALEEQLKVAYENSGGQKRATGVVTNPGTGEVLAMAVYPAFDLNDPWALNEYDQKTLLESGLAPDSKEYSELKSSLLLTCWSNKALTEAYVPGSTFKIITAAMALEEGKVKTTDPFNCTGAYVVNGITIHCHKTKGHGPLDFTGGIQQSCNPVLMAVGLRVGLERFYAYFDAFGYLAKSGIDLPGEGNSVFHTLSNFKTLDLATASFGQNFKITPVQHLNAIGAVANGGHLLTPHVVAKITDGSGNVIQSATVTTKRQVISSQVCSTISTILQEGVSGDGGASNAYVAGYRIAAKTGTSEKVGDNRDAYICSCVAYAPAENPRVAALIMVDEPTKGLLYGSAVAAPYIARLMETILPYMGVEAVYTDKELEQLAITVPNMKGYTLEQATAQADLLGVKLRIVGNGTKVTGQMPESGAKMERQGGVLVVYTGDATGEGGVTVPNLMGKTAAAANQLLINSGLNIRITGTKNHLSGTQAEVISQSHAPGEVVPPGTVITLIFSVPGATE